jgi:DedD protein
MDQGLKERLVGAAVLVALGVILIPWVLDGPDAPLETGTNSLQLPAAEEPMPMRTQTLRLDETVAPPAEEPAPAATAGAPAASETSPAPPETSVATTPVRAVPSPEPRTAAAEPPKPAATAAGGAWIVQLGVFGEEANARRMAQRSSTFGYKADVSSYRANGRTLYRVRVGSATSRGQADATASALRAHGLTEVRVLAAEP